MRAWIGQHPQFNGREARVPRRLRGWVRSGEDEVCRVLRLGCGVDEKFTSMPFSEVYRKQAALVVRALPEVEREECFALKGGTGRLLSLMPQLGPRFGA